MKKGRIHPALRRMTGILLILTIMAGTLTDAMESLFPAVSSLFRAMAEAGNEIEESVQEELWRYAAREDGFLSITGYTGDDTSALSVPVQIGGKDVVEIASGALANVHFSRIRIPGNVLSIAEDAFGENQPTVASLSGSFAKEYAQSRGLAWKSAADYDLVDGVVDFSDAPRGHIERRGNNYLVANALEAERLEAGSVIWWKDSRGFEYFYRVVNLSKNQGEDSYTISVTVPEIQDVIVNYTTTNTIQLTAQDITPQDGAVFSDAMPGKKDGREYTEEGNPVELSWFGSTPSKILGNGQEGLSGKWGGSATRQSTVSVSGTYQKTVTYSYSVENGRVVNAKTHEVSTASILVAMNAGVTLEEKTAALKDIGTEESTYTYSQGGEVETVNKKLVKLEDDVLEHTLGIIGFGNGLINVSGSIKFGVSFSIGTSVKFCMTEIEDKAFSETDNAWKVVKNSSTIAIDGREVTTNDYYNASRMEELLQDNILLKNMAMNAKAYLKAEIGIAIAGIVKVVQGELSIGVKGSACFEDQCLCLEIQPYVSADFFVGVWTDVPFLGMRLGKKAKLDGIGIDIDYDMALDKWVDLHHYFGPDYENMSILGDRDHTSSSCPFHGDQPIEFETYTGQIIEPINATLGQMLWWDEQYHPGDDSIRGEFLGYHTVQNQRAPIWSEDDVSSCYVVTGPATMYAVWENTREVRFTKSQDDPTEVADRQYVPYGGTVTWPTPASDSGLTDVVGWAYVDETGKKKSLHFEEPLAWNTTILILFPIGKDDEPIPDGTDAGQVIGDEAIKEQYETIPFSGDISMFEFQIRRSTTVDREFLVLTKVNTTDSCVTIPGEVYVWRKLLEGDTIYAYSLTDDRPSYLPTPDPGSLDYYNDYYSERYTIDTISYNALRNCTNLKAVRINGHKSLSIAGYLNGLPNLEYVDLRGIRCRTARFHPTIS